jgi:hypothetical protein
MTNTRGAETLGENACVKRQWFDDPSSLRFRLHQHLHKLTYGRIDHPMTISSLHHYLDRDAENNAESTPSKTEHIEVAALWAFEMYTPSTIKNLERGFRDLGWGELDSLAMPDPISWLQTSRGGQSGGYGWRNLGYVRRPGEDGGHFASESLRGPLPDFAEYANAKLYSLTPSITCLAICFVLKAEERMRIENAIRQTYSTYIKKTGKKRTISQPEDQKIRQITSIRSGWRETAAAWLSIHVPGLLSRNLTGCDLPICEFTLLEGVEPFSKTEGRVNTLLGLADLWHATYVFDAQAHPGLIVALDIFRRDPRLRLHSVLVATKASLRALNPSSSKLEEPGWFLKFAADNYEAALMRWACSSLLDYLERKTGLLRDVGRTLVASRRRTRVLDKLQQEMADSIDTATLCPELDSFTATKDGWFDHEVASLLLRPLGSVESRTSFSEFLAYETRSRANRLRVTDGAVKEFLAQQSALLSAYENIRLQRRLYVLAFIAVLAAIISIIEPARKLLGFSEQPPPTPALHQSSPDD